MLSEEKFDKLREAQKVISKLESGSAIAPNSKDHHILTWAILELTQELLISKRPLSKNDRDRAKQVARNHMAKR